MRQQEPTASSRKMHLKVVLIATAASVVFYQLFFWSLERFFNRKLDDEDATLAGLVFRSLTTASIAYPLIVAYMILVSVLSWRVMRRLGLKSAAKTAFSSSAILAVVAILAINNSWRFDQLTTLLAFVVTYIATFYLFRLRRTS